jgi:outer membrane protein OmpA-like peptidoglycan-associated protein
MGMSELRIMLGLAEPIEIKSEAFNLEQVEVSSAPLPEVEEEIIEPETTDNADLLTDVEELIPELDNEELDISPEITEPELTMAASVPLDSGEDSGELLEPVAAPKVDHVLDQIGRNENLFEEAAAGQIMIEEGSVRADVADPDELLKDMASRGSGGLSEEGLPSGYASIDGLLQMPAQELSRSRAALPSDLLFEYDSAQLRETARLGLMKLAMLIDRNPAMFCILEGHTDLYGGESYNEDLSRQRAAAVKDWLVRSMRLPGDRIIVRAFGKTQPKVTEGTIEEQALNRRVDILMRKDVPPEVSGAPENSRNAERTNRVAMPLPVDESEKEKPQPQESQPREPQKPLRALPVPDEASGEPSPPNPRPEPQGGEPNQPLRALPVEE